MWWGKQGDVCQRVQSCSYIVWMNKFGDLMYFIMIIDNNTVLNTGDMLRE